MREPTFQPNGDGPYLRISELPLADLQYLVSGQPVVANNIEIDGASDESFLRSYAARLLRERGGL